MTNRQRAIAAEVQAHRDELLEIARPIPCGYTIIARFPSRFVPHGYCVAPNIALLREAERVRYQEYRPPHLRRKGCHEPRWRTLARL